MDPVTAFSLAAGVLQVVDISFKAIKTCRELYKDGSLAKHRNTEDIIGALSKGTERLKAARAQAAKPRSPEDSEIFNLSAKCSELAEDLLNEFQKLRLERSGFRQAIKKSLRAIVQRLALKEKQELLEKYQSVLDTRILIRLDTRSLKESQNIEHLDQSIQHLVQGLEKGHNTFAQLLTTHSQAIQDHIDMKFENNAQVTAKLQAHECLLKSLLFPEILSRQEQIPKAFEGTYRWIFARTTDKQRSKRQWSSFRDWLEAGDDIYWISGKPGAGKSTLMKYIVNKDLTLQLLSNWRKGREILVISFFFWKAGVALQNSVTGLLRSLLYQIAVQWPELANLLCEKGGSTKGVVVPQNLHHLTEWTDERLLCNLKLFLDHKPSTISVCAFVDGLDEFVGDEELLLEMVRIFGNATGCKLCVSSRPEQAFRQEFVSCPQLRVQDLNHRDIERTATGKLSPHLNRQMSTSSGWKALIEDLIGKAQGVFLWLDLMITFLIKGFKNGDSYELLRARLDRTPDTINGMYQHILEGLDPLYREESLRYFHVLLVAEAFETSLSPADLVCAEDEPRERAIQFDREYFAGMQFETACQKLETRLVACCGGLIEIQDHWKDREFEEEEVDDMEVEAEGKKDEELEDEELEDEELEDEESEDKKSEDEELDDKEVEAEAEEKNDIGSNDEGSKDNESEEEEDLVKAAIISRYRRKVDFVHRTAMDYIREQHLNLPFEKSPSFADACTRLCIGEIGQLIQFSPTHTRTDSYKSTNLTSFFTDLMRHVSATEYLNDVNGTDETCKLLKIDLTHQAFQSLHHLYTFYYHSEQDPFSDALFLQCILPSDGPRPVKSSQLVSWCQVTDRLSAAAFFGCHQYVRDQLSTQRIADNQILNLFQVVISGLEYTYLNGFPTRYHIAPWLLTLRTLQQHLFDPNKLYIAFPSPLLLITYATLWGASFALMVMAVTEDLEDLGDHTRALLQSHTTDLVESFLSMGANPNTRIVSRVNFHKFAIYLEESPLAYMEHLIATIKTDFCAEIEARLRFAGAAKRRRFLYLGEYSRDSEARSGFCRLSSIESEQLIEAMRSSWEEGKTPWWPFDRSLYFLLKDESSTYKLCIKILDGAKNNSSKGDWIDEETVPDEIKASGDSFLAETTIRGNRPPVPRSPQSSPETGL